MRYAVLFPGQGSQFVGMGADVFEARPDLLGRAADEVLGWSLQDLCSAGPEEALTSTDRAQPALYGVGYALFEAFAESMPYPPVAAAGHSLGEYCALAAAGAFDFLTGLRLVAVRGRAMDRAARSEPSGMAALMGADVATAEEVASTRRTEGGRLWVANLNAPGQIVVAGAAPDLEWLADHGGEYGIRRVIPLKVAGAFHTPIMAPAAQDLTDAIAGVEFSDPRFPVYANVTAAPIGDIGHDLASQLVGTVRFAESLERMHRDGVEAFVHIGPGNVTAGMAKRCVPDAEVHTVSSLEDIATVSAALAVQ